MIGTNGKPQSPLLTILTNGSQCRDTCHAPFAIPFDKIEQRLHILAGLLIAYLHIDEVIRIIREEDDPKAELMTRYDLTEIQANAILDIRLRQLAIALKKLSSNVNKVNLEAEKKPKSKHTWTTQINWRA